MSTDLAPAFSEHPYIRRASHLTRQQLKDISEYFHSLVSQDDESLRKTHFFHDRYENIYLKTHDLDALEQLLDESVTYCAELIKVDKEQLRIGYWFNLMPPGHITTLHRHDDLDELVSGVIYLDVPEKSGDLIIYHNQQQLTITPRTGNYIFFDPATPHKVTENRSDDYRLSIAMNVGISTNDVD